MGETFGARIDGVLGVLKSVAPVMQLIGDAAGMLGTVAGLLALVPGLQFLAVPALALGGLALVAHYLNDAGRQGSFVKALTTKDVLLDAVGVVAGAGAWKAGKKILEEAKAAGAPTRMVPQLIGPAKEMPMGYFQLATGPYAMGQAEFNWRLASYNSTATGVVGVALESPDGREDLRDWGHLTFLKPVEEKAP